MANFIYIATSLDGHIADKDGGVDWLQEIPMEEGNDYGFSAFMETVDALVMGRKTYETVIGFDVPWPYPKKVFVLSNSLKTVKEGLEDRVEIINGELIDVVKELNSKGFYNLYIDGGTTIQGFLKEDLIDEIIISKIPILLGDGIPLFKKSDRKVKLETVDSVEYDNGVIKLHYRVLRD